MEDCYPTLLEALRAELVHSRREFTEGTVYPRLVIHRDLEGEHSDGADCWCEPLVLEAKDCWLDWTAEELVERLTGGRQ